MSSKIDGLAITANGGTRAVWAKPSICEDVGFIIVRGQGELQTQQVETLQLLHTRVPHEIVTELPQLSDIHLLCTFARVPIVVEPHGNPFIRKSMVLEE